jgi:hypothetical protein
MMELVYNSLNPMDAKLHSNLKSKDQTCDITVNHNQKNFNYDDNEEIKI